MWRNFLSSLTFSETNRVTNLRDEQGVTAENLGERTGGGRFLMAFIPRGRVAARKGMKSEEGGLCGEAFTQAPPIRRHGTAHALCPPQPQVWLNGMRFVGCGRPTAGGAVRGSWETVRNTCSASVGQGGGSRACCGLMFWWGGGWAGPLVILTHKAGEMEILTRNWESRSSPVHWLWELV